MPICSDDQVKTALVPGRIQRTWFHLIAIHRGAAGAVTSGPRLNTSSLRIWPLISKPQGPLQSTWVKTPPPDRTPEAAPGPHDAPMRSGGSKTSVRKALRAQHPSQQITALRATSDLDARPEQGGERRCEGRGSGGRPEHAFEEARQRRATRRPHRGDLDHQVVGQAVAIRVQVELESPGCPLGTKSCGWSNGARR